VSAGPVPDLKAHLPAGNSVDTQQLRAQQYFNAFVAKQL
jgi:hypothetical protein